MMRRCWWMRMRCDLHYAAVDIDDDETAEEMMEMLVDEDER